MNVMVMAGTKDAADIIKRLSKTEGINVIATTTTKYGANIAKSAGADEVISKCLTEEEIIKIIKNREIKGLIDATHPFAAEATRNAVKSSKVTGIKYIRFERPQIKLKDNQLIYKVFSFEEAALKAAALTNGNILHLAGVSTLEHIVVMIAPSKLFVRILPSLDSIRKCLGFGVLQENIIAMQGTFSKDFNKALMEEYNISLIITKESGETGGTPSKINAALELGIDIVLVTRPIVSELENKDIFTDLDELISFMSIL